MDLLVRSNPVSKHATGRDTTRQQGNGTNAICGNGSKTMNTGNAHRPCPHLQHRWRPINVTHGSSCTSSLTRLPTIPSCRGCSNYEFERGGFWPTYVTN